MKKLLSYFLLMVMAITGSAYADTITYKDSYTISGEVLDGQIFMWPNGAEYDVIQADLSLPTFDSDLGNLIGATIGATIDIIGEAGTSDSYSLGLETRLWWSWGEGMYGQSVSVFGSSNDHLQPWFYGARYFMSGSGSATQDVGLDILKVEGENLPITFGVFHRASLWSTSNPLSDHWAEFGGTTIEFAVTYDYAPIPEPTTMLLLGTGLLGVAVTRRKFNK